MHIDGLYWELVFPDSSEEEEEKPPAKKQMNLKFRNKKEAMDAFKALLKEKVLSSFIRHTA